MTTRTDIIEKLSTSDNPREENYNALKRCLVLNNEQDINLVDEWFKGIVRSLYYIPNRKVLILKGLVSVSKTFLINLVFNQKYFGTENDNIYSHLVIHKEFTKKDLDISEVDNFIIYSENVLNLVHPGCDKRLSSFCGTVTEWSFPQRKNFIVLDVEFIDIELLYSIEKIQLWKEIFYKFKFK